MQAPQLLLDRVQVADLQRAASQAANRAGTVGTAPRRAGRRCRQQRCLPPSNASLHKNPHPVPSITHFGNRLLADVTPLGHRDSMVEPRFQRVVSIGQLAPGRRPPRDDARNLPAVAAQRLHALLREQERATEERAFATAAWRWPGLKESPPTRHPRQTNEKACLGGQRPPQVGAHGLIRDERVAAARQAAAGRHDDGLACERGRRGGGGGGRSERPRLAAPCASNRIQPCNAHAMPLLLLPTSSPAKLSSVCEA